MKPTAKQIELTALAKQAQHLLAYGGSRSGKTYWLVHLLVIRAMSYPGSRHIILRHHFAHVKVSIWMDTLAKVMRQYPKELYSLSESDHVVRLQNGSEIWIDGLEDKDRSEKILGREYCTVYFNECSQLSYPSITMALTRLSQNVPGCVNRAYYDMNPAGRGHWAHKVFIEGVDPVEGKPIDGWETTHRAIKMNPIDNQANLPPDYLKQLANLPEHKRRRFLDGEWTDPEGAIFRNWSIIDAVPEDARKAGKVRYGIDYGYSVDPATLVRCTLFGDDLYIEELIYRTGLSNRELFAQCLTMIDKYAIIRADSAEPKSNAEGRAAGLFIRDAEKGPDSIRHGIDWLQTKRIWITRESTNLIAEFSSYSWRQNRNGRSEPIPIDDFNHGIDAIRYACEEYRKRPVQIVTL